MGCKYDALLKEMSEVMGEEYPAYNEEEMFNIGRIYLNAIDKEGYVYDFNQAWEWAGYSTKGNAKRTLLRDLRRNIDYKVTLDFDLSGMINQKSRAGSDPRGGDRKSEKIMLTAKGLNQFALSARTPTGIMLRDCIVFLMTGLKRLVTAVESGEYAIVKQPVYKCTRIKGVEQTRETWQMVRTESKVMTKTLADLLMKCGGGDLFHKVHSILNQKSIGISSADARTKVEGMRKGETVRNVATTSTLSELRNIQLRLTAWLEDLDEEDNLPSPRDIEQKLMQLCAEREDILASTRRELLKHPGALLRTNGEINPIAHKRVVQAITDGASEKDVRALAAARSTKKRRLGIEAPKKQQTTTLAKFGFVAA